MGINCVLMFNLSARRGYENRVAVFENIIEFDNYIEDERKGCIDEMTALYRAISKEARMQAKEELDEARWKFYNAWKENAVLENIIV